MSLRRPLLLCAGLAGTLLACTPPPGAMEPAADPAGDGELPLGELSPEDAKADGLWGSALTCKPVPSLPPLKNPRITLSLHGLTLHLTDDSGFDKVFPIGPGAIDTKEASLTYGESLSLYPLLATGKSDFAITPSTIQPCKTWWTDAETGEKKPVFAGLPFLSWSGNYAIHGPIDNYRIPSGGNLRRGFVSHGCIRMEAADVLELYARIKGVPRTPVHVQREPERDAMGRRLEVPSRWLGAECRLDGDCNFPGGFCKLNRLAGRGFCATRCTSTCADRAGYPTSLCVADPDDAQKGLCVSRTAAQLPDCRTLDHFVAVQQTRFKQPAVKAQVCLPGPPGWIAERCFVAGDCKSGNSCSGAAGDTPGFCTQPCARFCPDAPGTTATFCAAAPTASCLRSCDPNQRGAECPAGFACRATRSAAGVNRYACLRA